MSITEFKFSTEVETADISNAINKNYDSNYEKILT